MSSGGFDGNVMRTRFSASLIVESPTLSAGRVGEAARVSSWRIRSLSRFSSDEVFLSL